jgi:outer membrane PBP1 activator LpoA protein
MHRRLLPFLLAGLLTACGLDAASSAATAAKLKAREAEQAQTLKQNIEQQLDAARQQEEQRRKDAEAASR